MTLINCRTLSKFSLYLVMVALAFKICSHVRKDLRSQLQPLYLTDQGVVDHEHKVDDRDLVWFAQVSDIHISRYRDQNRSSDLRKWCSYLAAHVSPVAVLVSGDLTDAKLENYVGSEQQLDEWKTYYRVVRKCQQNLKWYDIRGNHDTFNVANDTSQENFFKKYSSQGSAESRSYLKTETFAHSNKTISFLAIDLTPVPGLRRPLNFFGILTDKEEQRVKTLMSEAQKQNDFLVTYGHYPISSVINPSRFRQLLAQIPVYLSGHYHTAYGRLLHMFVRHRTGTLELELGDWKDYRRYRIAAFDQGTFAFTDEEFLLGTTPNLAILVTNPKDPRSVLPHEVKKPLPDEIRLLIFAEFKIKHVEVEFEDGNSIFFEHKLVGGDEGPLYTAKWTNRDRFSQGVHDFTIKVTDSVGQMHHRHHTFSLDGSSPKYKFSSRLVLLMDWDPFSQVAFTFLSVVTMLFLLTLRTFKANLSLSSNNNMMIIKLMFLKWIRKFVMLATLDFFFTCVLIGILWQLLFPWYLGSVLEGRIGIIFSWGIIMLDDYYGYVRADVNPGIGVIAILLQLWPAIYVLSSRLESSFCQRNKPENPLKRVLIYVHYCSILVFMLFFVLIDFLSYGAWSLIGPLSLGKPLMFYVLYQNARNLTPKDVAKLKRYWSPV